MTLWRALSTRSYRQFVKMLLMINGFLYLIVIGALLAGWNVAWIAGLIAVIFWMGPQAFTTLSPGMEGRSFRQMVSVRHNSLVWLFGDAGLIASIVWWASREQPEWSRVIVWPLVASFVAGVMAYSFRRFIDRPRYTRWNALGSFWSPSKVAHDVSGLFGLAALLLLFGVPALLHDFQQWKPGLVGPGIWLVFIANEVLNEPDPRYQHPNDFFWE